MVVPHHDRLANRTILVVEDGYWVAAELQRLLVDAGARVAGPAPDVAGAMRLLDRQPLDAAIVDVNLDGTMSFALVDELERRGVPIMFATGYDEWALPESRRAIAKITKPFTARTVLDTLASIIAAPADSPSLETER